MLEIEISNRRSGGGRARALMISGFQKSILKTHHLPRFRAQSELFIIHIIFYYFFIDGQVALDLYR